MQLRSTFGLGRGRLRHEIAAVGLFNLKTSSAQIVFLTSSTDLLTLFTMWKNMALPMKKMRNVLEIAEKKGGCPGVVMLHWSFARIPQFGILLVFVIFTQDIVIHQRTRILVYLGISWHISARYWSSSIGACVAAPGLEL